MGLFTVFGKVILLTPGGEHADAIHTQVAIVWNRKEGWGTGMSRLPNDAGLVYKVVRQESSTVRAKVREFWSLVRPEVTGLTVPPEFLWR